MSVKNRGKVLFGVIVLVAALAIPITLLTYASLTDNGSDGQWTIEPNRHLIYNGSAQELVTSSIIEGTVLYLNENSEYTEEIPTGIDAGTYTVKYKIVDQEKGKTLQEGTVKATIMYKVVTVEANDAWKVYEGQDPELTATVSGLLGDDTIEYSIYREKGEDFGSYTIYVTGEEIQGNYSIQYVNAIFFIYTKVVTVTANDASKAFGTSDPTFTATVKGATGINYTLSRETGESVGTYRIYVTGDRIQGNYMVEYESGFFTIGETAASWSSLPSAISDITFDGYEKALVTAGSGVGGTVYYRLSTDNYSTQIPKASEPGTYTIYCKVGGDGNHTDSNEIIITTTINDYAWDGTELKQPKMMGDAYQIYIASELAWISAQNDAQNGFSGKTIEIKHDIDLNNKEWTPIGSIQSSNTTPFKGKFEGNGYTISNVKITGTDNYVGLFGYTYGGYINNITLDKANVIGSEYCAALAGYLNSPVSNVNIMHSSVTGNRYIGNIAGYQTAVITDSSVEYSMITCERTELTKPYSLHYLGNDAGGIAGMSNADIKRCQVSHITLNAYRNVGGIAGNIQENVMTLTVEGCDVTYSMIMVNVNGDNAGNIIGRTTDNTLEKDNTFDKCSIYYVTDDESSTETPNSISQTTYDYIILKADGTMIVSKDSVETTTSNIYQITLDNVTITAPDSTPAITIESGTDVTIVIKNTVTLTGGRNADGIRVYEDAKVAIMGTGTLTVIGNNGKEYLNSYYPGNVEESERTLYTGTGGSGIGNSQGTTGTIIIKELNGLYAYGYGLHAFGIGGNGGTVNIIKSTVNMAKGGFPETQFLISKYGNDEAEAGAGIGGSTITISGSTIENAIGGSKAAGIGAMYWQSTDITIVDSTIENAQGGNAAAGIGGSHPIRSTTEATIVNIVIEDSKVTATGGYYAAGIGSGYDRKCGTEGWTELTIYIMSYSEITATGGTYGAGIGTGFHSGILNGSIDSTVTLHVEEGTTPKTGDTYSYTAQSVGYGVVDYSREASSLMNAGTPVTPSFTVGGTAITNPFDPDRLAYVKSLY